MEERTLLEMLLNNTEFGVFAMSMVARPAVKDDFIYLSEEEVTLAISDEEKQIVTGLVLSPGQKIYRKNFAGYSEVDIMFSAETIEAVSQKFLKDFNQKKVTKDHSVTVQDVTLVESWIKVDATNDKSVALGLGGDVGAWYVSYKVEDEVLLNDIKSGKVRGFSIEGKFGSEPVSLTNNKSIMTKEENQVEATNVEASTVETSETTPETETPENEAVQASEEVTETIETNEPTTIVEMATSAASQILERVREVIGVPVVAEEAPAEAPVEDAPAEEEEATYVSVEAFTMLQDDVNALMEAVTMLLENYSPTEVAATEEVEVVEEVQAQEEVPAEEVEMVSLSEGKTIKSPKLKYIPGQTVQDRIKAGLGVE